MKPKSILCASGAAFLGFSGALGAAEMKRTELARHDLTGTNMEMIVSEVDVPPGASVPRHIHHGEEGFYILDGAQVQLPGKDPYVMATGSGGINARDVPHSGFKNLSDRVLKIVTVHVVDKGKTLYDPVP